MTLIELHKETTRSLRAAINDTVSALKGDPFGSGVPVEAKRVLYEHLVMLLALEKDFFNAPAPITDGVELTDQQVFNQAVDFAIKQGAEAATFLDAWRHGDTTEWPEFHPVAASESGGTS